jgi:hypothetical protein
MLHHIDRAVHMACSEDEQIRTWRVIYDSRVVFHQIPLSTSNVVDITAETGNRGQVDRRKSLVGSVASLRSLPRRSSRSSTDQEGLTHFSNLPLHLQEKP